MAENGLEGLSPQITAALVKAYADPAHRVALQKAIKAGDPSIDIPGLEVEGVRELVQKEVGKIKEETTNEIRTFRAENTVKEKRAALQGRGFTSEDIGKIEELMTKEGIGSYDLAARHYELEQQAAAPTPPIGGEAPSNLKGMEEAVKAGNLNQWANAEALDELRRMQRAR